MKIQQIPLDQLKPSLKNVRKTQTSVAQLAASIEADGLLQSLAVEQVNGHFEVVAGGRRLRALQQLVKDKKYPPDYAVACTVIESHRAAGVSLAENAIREAMRPTEQFAAFVAMLEQGLPEADVAARFGVTTLFLRQRMKLAKLSESVLEALETGEITLAHAEAFTLSDNHELQDQVLLNFTPGFDDESNIRAQLTDDFVHPTDRRVKYIGLAAYEKAGGAVVRDLFQEKDAGYLADAKLLDQLVVEKLEKSAKSVRAEGWGFVEVGPKINVYTFQRMFGDADKIDKASAGAIVTVGDNGKVEIARGYLRPGQKEVRDEATGRVSATAPPAKGKDAGKLSAAAVVRLQGFRTAVLQCEVGKNSRVALAALAAAIASQAILHSYDGVDRIVRISGGSTMGVQYASTENAQFQEQEDAHAMWVDRLPDSEAGVLAWLLDNPEQLTIDLLTFLSSRSIAENQLDAEAGRQFAQLAGVDMAAHWEVTAKWLQAQPTAYLVAAVTEACGKKQGDEVARAKGKAGAVAKAFELLATLTPSWLPAPLRQIVDAPKKKAPKVAKAAKAPKEATPVKSAVAAVRKRVAAAKARAKVAASSEEE